MKRNTWNFWLDLLSLLVMVFLILTGFLIHYILPPGSGGGHGRALTLWGMNRHDFGAIHFYFAVGLIALMIVHVALHWSWVCHTLRNLTGGGPKSSAVTSSRRIAYGITFLILLAVVNVSLLLWAKSHVAVSPGWGGHHVESSDHSAATHITGQMTLVQAAQSGNMPVEKLIQELQLPADTDPQERLGRLKRRYGFEIEEVRAVISRYQSRH